MNATIAPDGLDWDDLFRQYHQRVYKYMRQHTHQPGDSDEVAEDLTMNVFVRAIEAVGRGTGPRSHVAGWLFTIARNLLYDHYRTRARVPEFVYLDSLAFFSESDHKNKENSKNSKDDVIASAGDTPHDHLERAMTCQCVQRAIERLPGEQPYVVRQRMEGYEYSEIAAELGKSDGAAKQLQVRAWGNLKAALQGAQ